MVLVAALALCLFTARLGWWQLDRAAQKTAMQAALDQRSAQPPLPEWGALLTSARVYLVRAPWLVNFPGLAILVTVLGLNLLGDGLRDLFDPRLARQR